ncbi:MAG: hypothetical protein KGZ82_15570 [Bacteroidales bacterium]|nr:hypothetical protein [Bacteroidales bacterium]
MRSLSFITILLALGLSVFAQSPHGTELKISCSDCHHSEGWKLKEGSYSFDHQKTSFPLVGQHQMINCKSCHPSLVFQEAQPDCISCHTDIHQQTVGPDCARCHTPESWLVSNITAMHQISRFPLTGAHRIAECSDCHKSASNLVFEPLGVDCFDCHEQDYQGAKNPNHLDGNFSTNCTDCHNINAFSWSGAGINHAFFPLEKGHDINDCSRCHLPGNDYNNISAECFSCHQPDYQQTTNPNHTASGFPTDCAECHTLDPGWKPASMKNHDAEYFPIYSGKHAGEWDKCTDCHTTPSNFAVFSCIACHEHNQSDMNGEHDEVQGYVYESQACFECHPTGDAENTFNHATSSFPLTGAHLTTSCADCHTAGYTGTSTICKDCHTPDYDASGNPAHSELGLAFTCEDCHTTEPDWQPASFPVHNEYFTLSGAHLIIANNCFDCHEGNYTSTPNLCFGCHADDYSQTSNPPHESAQFSTACESCHSDIAWQPSTFDHDGQYFPVYSGKHQGEWNECVECHTNPTNYAVFSCIDCHEHNKAETDEKHNGVGGYVYESQACYACHPTGNAEDGFDHNLTQFPLSGAHTSVECIGCHANGYTGTTTVCGDCHADQFNQTTNPNHQSIGIPNTCETCHSTQPGWQPATFPIHENYYPLTGAHLGIASDCFACHQDNYNNTPNACLGCHTTQYNLTINPNHTAIGIPNTCEECHTTNPDWNPATFPIHSNYYVLQGAHLTIANQCIDCHNGNYNSTPNSCFGCHETDYNQTTNPPHATAQFPTDCEACHTQSVWQPSTFNHDGEYFPIYSGKHQGEWTQCAECHTTPSNYGLFSCIDCHEHNKPDTDDQHQGVGGYTYESQACYACHPTGNADDGFDHNQTQFPLTGAHMNLECISCHANGYTGTTTICADCHADQFSQTSNPDHQAIGIPNNCETCHSTQPGWSPASFPIHDNYYALTGAHQPIASDCFACHQGDYNNTPNACLGCHITQYNQSVNPNHIAIGIPNNCEECHTTNPDWQPAAFPIHNNYYVLQGAHLAIANQCADCHHGDYNNTPNSCYGCHQSDYNQANDPPHASAQFPTDCEMCHTQNAWTPSTFDHDNQYFPIYSGQHQGEWNTCTDCHTNPSNYAIFTCITCHTQAETAEEHDGVSGYSWNSEACLNCHPDGSAEGDKQHRFMYQNN